MAKDKKKAESLFVSEIFRAGVYKRNQGKVTRQVTFATIAIIIALGAARLYSELGLYQGLAVRVAISGLLLVVGIWLAYRLVNWPQFSNFLIAVEAEMNKVSWPSRAELMRSSLVVIIVIFALAGLLFGYDMIWRFLFTFLGVLHA